MSEWADKQTPETQKIEKLLKKLFPNHPEDFPPTAYRYNSASIRVRVVDESFKGKSRSEREKVVLPALRTLTEKTQSDITVLLLLAPDETDRSMMNFEFDHPTPSRL